MNKKFLILFFFSFQISFVTIGQDTWNDIKEKTLFFSKDFGGGQIIFYQTINNLKKAVRQIHGSGVYILCSMIYDVEINKDTIILRDVMGLNEYTDEKFLDEIGQNVTLIYEKKDTTFVLRNPKLKHELVYDKPLMYNWQGNYAGGERLDIEKLKNIPIEKRSIYPKHSFENKSMD